MAETNFASNPGEKMYDPFEPFRGMRDAYLEGHNVASWNSYHTAAERNAMDAEIARRAAHVARAETTARPEAEAGS